MQRRKTQVWLLEAAPRNPATGATITVRLAGGGQHAYRYFGAQWLAGLDRPPITSSRLGYGEDDGVPVWGLESAAQAMQLVWAGGAQVMTIAEHFWPGAAFTLRSGPDGGADGDFTLRLTGKATDARVDTDGILSLALADPTAALAVPAVPDTFAGSGGAEGPVDLKDRLKRRAFGPVLNVDLWPLDPANNIWVATDPARPLQGIPAAYDRGNAGTVGATIAWAGSVAATLAALIASSPPDGGFTRAPSIGCIKWWHSSPGLLTADLLGEIGGAYVDTAAQIAERIVTSRTAITFSTGHVATWAAARPGDAGILLDNPAETVSQALWRLLGPCTMWWHLDGDGKIALGEWSWGASAGNLSGGRVERTGTYRPMKKCVLGYRKNHRQMARGDIAAALLIGDIDGAQDAIDAAIGATNSVNLYRVEAAGVTSSIALAGAGISEVRFGNANGLDLTPAASNVVNIVLAEVGLVPGDVISVSALLAYSDAGGDDARLRVRFKDAAGAEVGLTTGNPQPTPLAETRFELPNLTIPASTAAITVGSRLTGGTGTATVRNVMVNRGPICAPYSPPTRGATSNVNRGAWSSASVVYSIGDEVLSQGSTWGAKVGHVSSGGNGPPSLPTTENTNWILRSAKGDAGASGTDGDPGYTLNVAGNVAKVAGQPASLNCATSSASWGHGSAYSSQVFVNGAALWFNTPNTHGGSEQFMIGLNDNPGSSTGFADIDHALYFREDIGDVVEIYESGTARTLLTGGTTRAWSSANKYGITYDGRYVRYWEINGTTATKLYENDVGANKAFGLDVSAYHRLSLTNIAFSPKGADGLDAVTVSPPSVAYSIACDSAGNPKAGEFNKVTTFAVLQGTVDLSDHADTDYSVSNTNCSATMGGTNGKVLTQTAMSAATAKSVVTIQRSGVTVSTVDVSLTKALEGASARRVVDDTISAPSSSSYGAANGGTLEMALNTGETAIASFSAGYAATSSGSFFVSARIEYREKGSPTWLLLDSEAAGSIAIYLDDPGSVGISVDLVGSGGLKVYEFQLLLKRSNTGPTMNWNPGKFQVSVS